MDPEKYASFEGVIDLVTPPRAKRARLSSEADASPVSASSTSAAATEHGPALGALLARKHKAQATRML